MTRNARFLLVHGSCHGAWCWRDVIPALEALGHSARAIDLPSHGDDPTPYADVTLEMYRDAILDACETAPIVVGHSMAGFPIAAAAEHAPEAVSRLVFLCAYAPISGTSLVEMRKMATRQPILEAIEKTEDGRAWQPIADKARAVFYHDVPDEAYEYARTRLVPQAILPQATPLDLGANYACVPILLKNSYLIGGGAADSILSTTGRIGDDGTKTGGASGVVLRVLA